LAVIERLASIQIVEMDENLNEEEGVNPSNGTDNSEVDNESQTPTIRFNYRKGKDLRVIRADGAWGGISPRGDILMSIFTERLPIPEYDEHEISEDGSVGRRVQHYTNTEGIIREVEVTISLHPVVAITIANWLMNKVRQFERTFDIDLKEEIEKEKEGRRGEG
jgi:hypothetical protein